MWVFLLVQELNDTKKKKGIIICCIFSVAMWLLNTAKKNAMRSAVSPGLLESYRY